MEERRRRCFTLPLTGLLNTRALGIFKRNNTWSFTQEMLRMLRRFGLLLPKTSDPAAKALWKKAEPCGRDGSVVAPRGGWV